MNSITKSKTKESLTVSNKVRHILDVVELDDTICALDVGSWNLNQSIELSNIFPNAKVYAFEPTPESYELCKQKCKLNPSISVYNYAVTNFCGEAFFYPLDPSKTSSTNFGVSSLFKFKEGLNGGFLNDYWIQKEISVKTTTLDQWSLENNVPRVDMVWIDVQGAELLVFQGAKETLKNTKVIFSEVGLGQYYEGQTLKTDIDKLLESYGFVEFKSGFVINHRYEGDAIYINKKFL